jgi:hypothetical protein
MNQLVPHLKKEKERLLKEQERLTGLISSIDTLLNEYILQGESTQSYNSINDDDEATTKAVPKNDVAVIRAKKGHTLKDSIKNAILGLERFDKGSKTIPILLKWYPEKATNLLGFQTQLSGILSDLGKTGEIVKFQFSSSKKDTVWGKPEWLDENGKPKEGFEPILE